MVGSISVPEDRRFEALVSPTAELERLHTGCGWAEGPVWSDADGGFLLFSDIYNHVMLRWSEAGGIEVFRADSNFSNGNTRDREGRLISCEHGSRHVVLTEADGRRVVIADRYQGRRLNSPNDVVVRSDGTIWFTDPTYGIISPLEGYPAASEQPGHWVYRVGTDREVRPVATDFVQPNGLAFSCDERTLYVADSGFSHDPTAPHHVRAFDVADDGSLARSRVFADIAPGVPDGLRVDEDDRVWISAGDGVHCYAPDGVRLGRILVPETVANLCFGGADGHTLFLTATTSLYRVRVATRGTVPRPH